MFVYHYVVKRKKWIFKGKRPIVTVTAVGSLKRTINCIWLSSINRIQTIIQTIQ
jgi:hypothetical protein